MSPDRIRRAGRVLAQARAERDALPVDEAARLAYTPGGPSVEAIADTIRRHRAEAKKNRAAHRAAA